MTRATRWTVGAFVFVLGFAGLIAVGLEWPEELGIEPPEGFSSPRDAVLYGTLPDELSESSGVAVSRSQPGVLWTHNDSGNRQILFAIDSTGRILGRFAVEGARLRDWEDIALGPCLSLETRDRNPSPGCLYLADTGDNMRRRDEVRVYVVSEPNVAAAGRTPAEGTVQVDSLIRISYGDGRYNVEALAVDGGGNVYLINKGPGIAVKVMRIRRTEMTGQPVTPEVMTELDVTPMRFLGRLVTGAAITPDGSRMVVRTYIELLFYRFDQAGIPLADGPPCFLGLLEPQGEAVDFLTDETVVTTSEALAGRPGTIYGVTCSQGV